MSELLSNPSVIILTAVALLPAVGLMIYIYKMDRVEKEPKGLLTGLFFLGVGAAVPVIFVEMGMGAMANAIFGVYTDYAGETIYPSVGVAYAYEFFSNFFCVALVEEAFKWLFMFLLTHKNKNFNCLFDGVVYAVFVSLGFAACENILYVLVYGGGFSTGLLRAVTAVPAHCFFGVLMGYFYSVWALRHKAASLESTLRKNGVIPQGPKTFNSGAMLALSLIVPVAAHGFYDFTCSVGTVVFFIIFLLFLGFLYFLCFRGVFKLARKDSYTHFLSMDMVLRKYPGAVNYVRNMPEYAMYFAPVQPVQQPVQQPFAQPVQQPVQQPFAQPFAQPASDLPFAKPEQEQQHTDGDQN